MPFRRALGWYRELERRDRLARIQQINARARHEYEQASRTLGR